MIITIDCPAGTGKSTVAQAVAAALGFDFLDTGAMYRAIGLAAVRREVPLEDARELAFVAKHSKIRFDFSVRPPSVTLNGEPVGHLLRSGEATRAASFVAVVPAIRQMLVEQQREIGREHGNLVTEGRDQGSVVFPDAQLKFYLDATPQERASRRVAQLRSRGEVAEHARILEEIISRDHRDASRGTGPLTIPAGAIVIDTTTLSQEQVIAQIVSAAREMISEKSAK
jgi:cytidylate kinase